jgi:hypothetical protein
MLSRWFLAQLIFSTLKMEAICSSETSVNTQQTTRHYIPEDATLHNNRCENLKSYMVKHDMLFRNVGCLVCFHPAITLVSCSTYFFDPEDGDDMFLRNIG